MISRQASPRRWEIGAPAEAGAEVLESLGKSLLASV